MPTDDLDAAVEASRGAMFVQPFDTLLPDDQEAGTGSARLILEAARNAGMIVTIETYHEDVKGWMDKAVALERTLASERSVSHLRMRGREYWYTRALDADARIGDLEARLADYEEVGGLDFDGTIFWKPGQTPLRSMIVEQGNEAPYAVARPVYVAKSEADPAVVQAKWAKRLSAQADTAIEWTDGD